MAKRKATNLKNLRLDELSLVDNPANKSARVTVAKRGGNVASAIVKLAMCDTADGKAHSFDEIFEAAETQRQQWEANEELWPLFDALTTSIRTIAADKALQPNAKLTRVQESVDAFVVAIREKWPEVEQELEKLLKGNPATAGFFVAGDPAGDQPARKGDRSMADQKDEIADLKKKVADLTEKLEKSEASKAEAEKVAKLSDAERSHFATLTKADDRTAFLDATPAKRRKEIEKAGEGDEVIKVGGVEIRKSAVGDATFAVMKAQQAQLDEQAEALKKSNEKAEMVLLTKRADDEFKHVPGSTEERAKMLKAIGGMDEPLRKSFEAVFTQSEKLAVAAFTKVGHGNGQIAEGSAQDKLDKLAKSYSEQNKVTVAKAMDEVLKTEEGRKLYGEIDAASPAKRVA